MESEARLGSELDLDKRGALSAEGAFLELAALATLRDSAEDRCGEEESESSCPGSCATAGADMTQSAPSSTAAWSPQAKQTMRELAR